MLTPIGEQINIQHIIYRHLQVGNLASASHCRQEHIYRLKVRREELFVAHCQQITTIEYLHSIGNNIAQKKPVVQEISVVAMPP